MTPARDLISCELRRQRRQAGVAAYVDKQMVLIADMMTEAVLSQAAP